MKEAVYRFGPFRLDAAQGLLYAGGREVVLTPKAFDTLRVLVEKAGAVVSKSELMDSVWPESHVDENNLAQNISLVRRTLATHDPHTEYVQTLARRGYRFAVSVTGEAPHIVGIDRFEVPRTRYARSGNLNIAYQVVGDGPIDVVFVMGWVSHLEMFWAEPSFARFLRRLSSFSRLIIFDKRGTGLSDPVPLSQLPTLEQRMDDVRAVMSEVRSRRAVLVGVSEGGPMTALFAATYPELVAGIVIIGGYARRLWAPDYPWGPTAEQRDRFIAALEAEWGGPFGLEERAPSRSSDPDFREWWAKYLRMGASPGAAAALTRMNAGVDVRNVLPSVRVPALVIHRTGDHALNVDHGRYLAGRIPGARFVELPGEDHLPFVGDQESIIGAIERFASELGEGPRPTRVLATLLFIRTDDAPQRLAAIDEETRREVEWFHGRKFAHLSDGLIATFDGPARAIHCAQRIVQHAGALGIRLGAGIHTGECDLADQLSGPTVEIGALLAEAAPPGEIVVSETVTALVAGSGLDFEPRGNASLGRLGDWAVYTVKQTA
jgi:pimeloyl-ACP methyl ester carboxylesterase/DNA-binding winged helix-turn-helix (wHTH) protein